VTFETNDNYSIPFEMKNIIRLFSTVQLLVCLLSVKRTGSELSESCFTFCKQTIYREPSEKVRYAGHTRGRHVTSKSGHKQHSKVTGREGATDDLDTSVPRKKAKQSEAGSSLAKHISSEVDVLPPLAADSRRPKSIMILPDADILEHEAAEKQNPEVENTGDLAEDLCTLKATRTDTSLEERFLLLLLLDYYY